MFLALLFCSITSETMEALPLLEGLSTEMAVFFGHSLSVIWKDIWSNISNTRKSVSSEYPNPQKWVGKTRRSRVFLTNFEVFGYLMKHSFEFLIWLLKPFIILGEIQSKSSQNLMLIKIRYPNHRHSCDFLCFLLMNYEWVWEVLFLCSFCQSIT